MSFPAIASIESARLLIRPVAETDLPALLEINGDDAVTRFLPYASWRSLEDAHAWLARMRALEAADTARQFVIVRRIDARVIGTLLLFRYEAASRRLELGYLLGRPYWGHGFMAEAIDAACTAAFTTAGIRRIEAEVNPDNLASCRVLGRMGFVLEGRLRQRWTSKGRTYDTHLYACLAEEWAPRRSFP